MCLQAKEKVNRLIQAGIDAGARLILDGRHLEVYVYIYVI